MSIGAARKANQRESRSFASAKQAAREPAKRSSQYKDKWTRASEVRPRPGPAVQTETKIPKHVAHCFNRGARDWWVYTWKRAQPDVKTRVPYSCNSWRCEVCRRHEASVTFARIKQACEPFESEGWVYLVLTVDRLGTFSGQSWADAETAYRELSRMTRTFLRRLRRLQRRREWRETTNEWVAVVEAHRSGWPHVNLMVYAPELAAELEADRLTIERGGYSHRQAILLRGELLACATDTERSGAQMFGQQSTAEQCRKGRDALAGYLTKLAGHADEGNERLTAEVAKLTQLPLNAPVRFRRLRSGKGFLPERITRPEVTGTLMRRGRAADGTPHAVPLHTVKDPTLVAHVAAVTYHEERLLLEELSTREWNDVARGLWPEAVNRTALVSVWTLPAAAAPYGAAPVVWETVGVAGDTQRSSPKPTAAVGRTLCIWS